MGTTTTVANTPPKSHNENANPNPTLDQDTIIIISPVFPVCVNYLSLFFLSFFLDCFFFFPMTPIQSSVFNT